MGRAEETWRIRDELATYGVEPTWFGLGDLDIATHLVRTQMLDAGYPLSDVTAALCDRWTPGVRLLPMSDERCETHVVVDLPGAGRNAIHFQEWWLRLHATVPAREFASIGAESAKPAPGVLDAIAAADVLMLPPSNPVVSIGAMMLVFAAAYQLFDCVYIVYYGALRGAGDTLVPAIVTAVLGWSITVGGGLLLAQRFHTRRLG